MPWIDTKYNHLTGTHCWFCDREFGVAKTFWTTTVSRFLFKTKEHIIPLKRLENNIPKNYIASCNDCNQLKGARDAKEFALHLDYLVYFNKPGTHNMLTLMPLMKRRAWKLYNKTSDLHKKHKNTGSSYKGSTQDAA